MREAWRRSGATRMAAIVIGAFVIIAGAFTAVIFLPFGHVAYEIHETAAMATSTPPAEPIVTHLSTPEPLKAIYMTACTASERRLRDKVLVDFDGTELNALVIDLKDYTGSISYASTTVAVPPGGRGCRIVDLPQFLRELHRRGIYAIARLTTFQDPLYANTHPELAIQSKTHPGKTWKDRSGLAYLDPGAPSYWDYVVSIAKEAYSIGFDEVNFDYIRFPSDGDLSDMEFSWSAGRPKAEVIRTFFLYLRESMASTTMPLSADLFGLTTSATGDMGIGQILENALTYFDYVAPMVYPSHFASTFQGFARPAEHPYEVVKYSMTRAAERAVVASTTPQKLRPWLQDFDLGAIYTPAMVRAQIQATYDSGLTSWMLWNAASVYHKDALAPKGTEMTASTTATSTITGYR